MSNILTIIKKELKRFFTDKRMLVSLFLPGILIYIIYSFMGSFISSSFTADDEYDYIVYTENMPEEYNSIFDDSSYNITYVTEDFESEVIKEKVKENEYDLYIKFEEGFTEKINQGIVPQIEIYYNSSSPESFEIYEYFY